MITKEIFIKILEEFEEKDIIEGFFSPNSNTILVITGEYGENKDIFYFDNNNNLVDLGKIRKEIKQLEIRKTQLERQLEHLTEFEEEEDF